MLVIGGAAEPSVLATYMPLIVGLSAVFGSLFANAILELFKQQLVSRRACQVTAAILIAELGVRLAAARGGISSVDTAEPGQDFRFAVPERHSFYTAHMREIGHLGPKAAGKVVKAYAQIEASTEFLAHYAAFARIEGILFATVLFEHRVFLRAMNSKIADLSSDAISELQKSASGRAAMFRGREK
jgi:hypothetical protein